MESDAVVFTGRLGEQALAWHQRAVMDPCRRATSPYDQDPSGSNEILELERSGPWA